MAATALRPDGGRWLRGVGRLAMPQLGLRARPAAAPAHPSRGGRRPCPTRACSAAGAARRAPRRRWRRPPRRWRGTATACIRSCPTSVRCCASRPQLSPPSQDSRFQIGTVRFSSSMREAGGLERLAAVRSRHGDHHGRVAQLHHAGAVQQRHPADHRPAAADLAGDGPQPGEGGLLVGLVLEAVDARAALGVVAGGAGEGDGGAAVGPHHPRRWPRRPAAGSGLSATQSSPDVGAATAARSIGPP